MTYSNEQIAGLVQPTRVHRRVYTDPEIFDLEMERIWGGTWIYNYLKGFYVDESTVSGWNNVVFENVAMPHVLAGLQGRQRAVFKEQDGKKEFDHFEQETEGSMSQKEFNQAMRDLTNFLVYMGEPAKLVRIKYGIYTMLFLFVFGVLAYLLKREYWRDVDVSH